MNTPPIVSPQEWAAACQELLGRQEEWEVSPEGYPQTPAGRWWNYHDVYGEDGWSPASRACRSPDRLRQHHLRGPGADGGRHAAREYEVAFRHL